MSKRDYYEVLGVARSASSDEIRSAYRRLARQYHKIRGERDRTKFMALKKGYHGTHFGAASVNGNANFRRNYEPLLPGCPNWLIAC